MQDCDLPDFAERAPPMTSLPTTPNDQREQTLKRLRWLADLFDDRFRLPFTGRRFGLDGILGLIPGIGDAATGAVSLYLAAEGWRLGMPMTKMVRMGANVGIDMVLGAIPLIGDLFDFAWKSNQKNVRLVLEHLEEDVRDYERKGDETIVS